MTETTKKRNVGKTILKIGAWTVGSIVGLLVILVLALQLPSVQNYVTDRATGYLEKKLKTRVDIGEINVAFPKSILLKDIYLEDQQKDTLLYAHRLAVDIGFFGFFAKKIDVNRIELERMTGHVNRTLPDSSYNFDFIVHAFSDSISVAETDTTPTQWRLTLDEIALNDIYATYQDAVAGQDVQARVGDFSLSFEELDLIRAVYKIDAVSLSHSSFSYVSSAQNAPQAPAGATTSTPEEVDGLADTTEAKMVTGLNELNLEDIRVHYADKNAGQLLQVSLGEVHANADTFDLRGQAVSLENFSLEKSSILYHQDRTVPIAATQADAKKPATDKPTDTAAQQGGWRVRVNELLLDGNQLTYDDFNTAPQATGMDFAHLLISDMHAEVRNIVYAGDVIQANIETLQMADKSGFAIRELHTDFSMTDTSLYARSMVVRTNQSSLEGDLEARFASMATLSKTYPDMRLDMRIPKAHLVMNDALYFQPGLLKKMPLKLTRNSYLNMRAFVNGQVKNLRIQEFTARTLERTRLAVSGYIRNLPDIDRTRFDVAIEPFATSATDIRSIVPASMLPANVGIPQTLYLEARLKGTTHDLYTQADLRTSLGKVLANLNLRTNQAFSNGSYSGKVQAVNVELGKLLKQDSVGRLNATATVQGSGFSMDQIKAQVGVRIHDMVYNSYTYKDVILDGLARPSLFAFNAWLTDPNANLALVGSADFREKVPHYIAVLDLKHLEMKKLHLSQTDAAARAQVRLDVKFQNLDSLNGNVDIRQVALATKGKVYTIDSLLYVSVQEKERTDIRLSSDVINGYFRGNINLSGMAAALQRHLGRYYSAAASASAQTSYKPQNFEFELAIANPSILTDVLVPDLDSLKPGVIKGRFDSEKGDLDMQATVYTLKYGSTRLDSARLVVRSNPERLRASFRVREIQQAEVRLRRMAFIVDAANDSLLTRLQVRDSANQQKYLIAGVFKTLENDSYLFRLLPDSLKLNYVNWQVPANNAVRITKQGILLEDVSLSSNGQQLTLANYQNQPSSFAATFEQFQLSTLGEMFRQDTALVSGTLNGNAQMFRLGKDTVLTANMQITKLSYTGYAIGDMQLKAEQKQKGRFDVNLGLTGNDNDVQVDGYYQSSAAENALNFDAVINRLNLKSFEGFAKSQLKEMSGAVTGRFEIRGSTAKPDINGRVTFQNALLRPTLLNSPLRIHEQNLQLDGQGLHFRNFTITDSLNHTATIYGDVLTSDFSYYKLDLRVRSTEFLVMNTTEADNKMYYGKVLLNSNVQISGDSHKPVVRANLRVGSRSNFTYVVTQSEEVATGREGIVEFRDVGSMQDVYIRQMVNAETQADTTTAALKGFEFSANIEVDSTTTVNVVIDPIAGDQLVVKGETTLSLNIDPSGDMDLTGRYEILYGTYRLSFFNLVQRQFTIEKNSSITWTGDPLKADMNIRAAYRVETQPLELLKNQLTTQDNVNQYKQRLPFLVYLNLKGQLMKPQISFNLDMPVDKQNALEGKVYREIQILNTRESELNKQVFALFLLQRFFADNPLESSPAGLESNVRTSVSKILTDQLNQLADKIQGIDLTLDVNSYQDYSSGEGNGRTELQLGLSKNLFSDRITVKVTGNVDIEGSNTTSQRDMSSFLGDLQLEYRLTDDGRLRLLGFRRRDFDVLSGELTKTGVGIIFVRDYNSFRELFNRDIEE